MTETTNLDATIRRIVATCEEDPEHERQLALCAQWERKQIYDRARAGSEGTFMRFGIKTNPHIESRNAAAWTAARKWEPQGNLWIYGPKGTGKTFMSRWLLNEALWHGVTVGELSGIALDSLGRRFDWIDRVDTYADCRLLLLDDLDKAHWSEVGITALWWLIDQRWDKSLVTIISTNWTPEAFAQVVKLTRPDNETFAGTLMDRLSWPGKPCRRIELTGTSLRREHNPCAGLKEER